MHGEQSFIPLLTVVTAAMVTGIILPRLTMFRIPLVVGEILIGIVLGESGFAIIPTETDPWLELLSLFGFTFLMFLSGLEIDFRSLAVSAEADGENDGHGLRRLLKVTFGIFAATLLFSTALSLGLVGLGYLESPWIMALIMSTTSVGLVMPLLKERGEADSRFGQIVILSAVVADFATMLLITVFVAAHGAAGITVDVLIVGTLFILFFGVLFFGKRLLTHQASFVKRIAFTAPKTAELSVRVSMTLMLGFVVFSQFIGAEIILGAFLAGTAISSLSRKSVHGLLGMKLDAIGFGFFIPIFFIMVGARFDMHSLLADPASLMIVPILVVFAFAVKIVPGLLLARFFGRRNALAAGFLLSSRLSLIIAASAIGLRLGLISPQINTAIILVAIITCVVSPAIYDYLRRKGEEEEKGHQEVGAHVQLDPLVGRSLEREQALDLSLVEIEAEMFPFLVDRTLAEAKLRPRTGMTLLSLTRLDGDVVDAPGGNVRVLAGDALVLIGTEAQIARMEALGKQPGGVRDSSFPEPEGPGKTLTGRA